MANNPKVEQQEAQARALQAQLSEIEQQIAGLKKSVDEIRARLDALPMPAVPVGKK